MCARVCTRYSHTRVCTVCTHTRSGSGHAQLPQFQVQAVVWTVQVVPRPPRRTPPATEPGLSQWGCSHRAPHAARCLALPCAQRCPPATWLTTLPSRDS